MPRPFFAALLFFAAAAGPAAAKPDAGKVQPDKLDVGTVYTGAVVEASFLVFDPGTDATVKLDVAAPKFVTVLRTDKHVQAFGQRGSFVCGTVELAFDTAAAGEFAGEVAVTLGKTAAKVPVAAVVRPRPPGLPRLLVAGTPFERYSTGDGNDFKVWTDLARDAPLDPSYLLIGRGKPVLRDLDLGQFDCLLLTADALVFQTPEDVKRARAFAERGGRVVVTANAFFVGSVKGANAVLDGYGIEVRDEEAGGAGGAVVVDGEKMARELADAGVGSARFFRASPVRVTRPKAGRVLVPAAGVGEEGDGFVAAGKAGRGQVVALGQSLWWSWVGEDRAGKTDNAKLLRWLLTTRRGE